MIEDDDELKKYHDFFSIVIEGLKTLKQHEVQSASVRKVWAIGERIKLYVWL